MRRFEEWCADPSRRRAYELPIVFTPWPVHPSTLRLFLQDFCDPPPDEDEQADWVPPAAKTVDNIVSALKWQTERTNVHWESTPHFEQFLKGLRNTLNEASSTNRAAALVVEQLAVIGSRLLGPSADTVGDLLAVICHGLGLGLAATARLTGPEAEHLAQDDTCDPVLRSRLSDLLSQPTFAERGEHEPLLGSYPQQIRQILLRCSRDAGLSDGKTSRRHTVEEVCCMVEMLHERPDPSRLRDHAMLTVGFAAALRRSEMSRAKISWIELRDNGFEYNVHFSKTNKTNRPECIGVPESPHLSIDPDRALRKWFDYLDSQGRAEPSMPLFPAIDRHGRISDEPVSGDAIAEMIRKRVLEAGVVATEEAAAAYSGHSLRRGFCTSAAERGHDALAIAGHTRTRT